MIRNIRISERAIRVILIAFLASLPHSVSAQKGIETGTPFGKGEDSIRCLHNTILYSNSFKNKDFKAALVFWREVLSECPASSEDIYIRGESMYKEFYRTTGDTAYIDSVLMILSQRTLYFKNKPSNDLNKSLVLSEFGGNDPIYMEQCYSLIKEVADSFPDYIDQSYSVLLMAAAARAFSMNMIDTAQVVVTYSKAIGIVETRLEDNPGDPGYIEAANRIDSIVWSSGVMTCRNIERLYSQKVEKNINDTKLVDKVFRILVRANCTGSDLYYRIAAKMFANKRSAENAVRLAEMFLVRKNKDNALWYFTEAFKLDTNKIVKSDVLTRIASMELAAGKKQDARNHCEYAFELNNKNGKALMIIADIYAGSKIGDAFDNHSVYWLAVDYLNSAKRADPSLTEIADKKINAYVKLFPTRSEGFFRGITDEGIVYRVGAWIDEVTIVRFRKE